MFKPWKYEGYYYDSGINAYICESSGYAHTLRWMAANASHLRVKG